MHWRTWGIVLTGVGLLSLQTWAQTPSVAKETVSPGAIEQLIRQLGSSDFQEREAASKKLEAIGVPALGALRRATGSGGDLEIRRRAEQLISRIENSLDGLLAAYRAHGLPLPPPHARLVSYREGGVTVVNRKVQPVVNHLAFEIELASKTEGPTFLHGPHRRKPTGSVDIREVAPRPDAVEKVAPGSSGSLGLAIQCHARGWKELAGYLLKKSQKDAQESPRQQVLDMAWWYWEGQITAPGIDRAPVARRLKELMRQDRERDTEENRELLRCLELALAPRKARPRSIDALVDDLVDYQAQHGPIDIFKPEDCYWRLARLGFEAVPTLIAHVDDNRLTRAMEPGFNNRMPRHLCVRDVVMDILEGLAGEENARPWLPEQTGGTVKQAELKKWWDEARKTGEEAYLLAHVLPPDPKAQWVREHMLKRLLVKYPHRLPQLYRTALEKHPRVYSWPLAEAVHRCPMPAREKVALFVWAADHKDYEQRMPALRALAELDRKQFNSLLLAAIDNIPTDVPGDYWSRPEARIFHLVLLSDDPAIWPTVEKVARRSCLGLRIEILHRLSYSGERQHYRQRLRLLSHFLDDAALRDEDASKKFGGPCAGFLYHKITVRDCVALDIAELLGINVPVQLERTPEQWSQIRHKIQDALNRELDKKE
jgi:hypothetical protein